MSLGEGFYLLETHGPHLENRSNSYTNLLGGYEAEMH